MNHEYYHLCKMVQLNSFSIVVFQIKGVFTVDIIVNIVIILKEWLLEQLIIFILLIHNLILDNISHFDIKLGMLGMIFLGKSHL